MIRRLIPFGVLALLLAAAGALAADGHHGSPGGMTMESGAMSNHDMSGMMSMMGQMSEMMAGCNAMMQRTEGQSTTPQPGQAPRIDR